jgi:hypothetical protein
MRRVSRRGYLKDEPGRGALDDPHRGCGWRRWPYGSTTSAVMPLTFFFGTSHLNTFGVNFEIVKSAALVDFASTWTMTVSLSVGLNL